MDWYQSRPRGHKELNHQSSDSAPSGLIAERAQQSQVSAEWSPALLITLWAYLVLGGRHRSPATRGAGGGDGQGEQKHLGAEPKSLLLP